MPPAGLRTSSHPKNSGESTSVVETAEVSETQKKSRRHLLEVVFLLAIGAILFSPALTTPLFLDDHLQGAMVEGTFPAARSPLNLYDFVDDGDRKMLTDRGLLPWWSHPQL